VRVIKPSRIREYAKQNPDAMTPLMAWLKSARVARWSNINQVRQRHPAADGAKVASGNTVTVFNIGGNKYRLIVSINYRWGMLYVLRFLTHVEYDQEKWKAKL
jgi:mRNA interferase HigB